jgi:hypothetical protein
MAHKVPVVILHIGLAKTGTSAVQEFLHSNRQQLYEAQGVLYPGDSVNHWHLQSICSSMPHLLRQIRLLGISTRREAKAFAEKYQEQLLAEVEAKKPGKLVLSSEYLSGMSLKELYRLRQLLESLAESVVIFGYVRDPWTFSISLLQEEIRAGHIDQEVPFGYMRSNLEILAKFEKAFDCRVDVAPYDGLRTDFDVVGDFCERFGISTEPAVVEPPARVNSRMSREAASVMIRLNKHYPTLDDDGLYIFDPSRDWMVEALLSSPRQGTKIGISDVTIDEIFERSKADIAKMEGQYFRGERCFSDMYARMPRSSFDDTLSCANLTLNGLAEYMLSCMRVLSDRALYYHEHMVKNMVERLLWQGRYYMSVSDLDLARLCLEEGLEYEPDNLELLAEMKALDERRSR